MDHNVIENIKQMLSGMSGMIKHAESMIKEKYENISPEHAMTLHQTMKDHKIHENLEKAKADLHSLHDHFKNI